MKKLLILFANGFPYNISEPFLENEYPFYREYFDKVLIVTECKRGENPTRQVEDPCIEIINDYTLSRDFRSVLKALPHALTDRKFYGEWFRLIRSKAFTMRRFYEMTVTALCGNQRAYLARKWVKSHNEFDQIVIYSYWLTIPAYAALKLKKLLGRPEIRAISRCHGYDIYSERHKSDYIPFQGQNIRQLDEVAPASLDGKKYLEAKYGEYEKMHTWYLGATDTGKRNPCTERAPMQIVSCARVVPIKRLERIVDALALIKNIPVRWTHIGGGDGLEALIAYANTKLSGNIECSFLGTIPNCQIYQQYQNTPYHAFVSVSASEGGAPVSICEALSFGIPVIATAVGGQPEAVLDGRNGYLLDRDYEDAELAQTIERLALLPAEEYEKMRAAARQIYDEKFDAVKNGREFIETTLLQQRK